MKSIQQVMTLYRQGRFAEVEAMCLSLLRDRPDQFDALLFLGTVLMQQGRPAEAVPVLERAVRANAASTDAIAALAGAFYALNRRSEALAQFNKILALRPADIQALYNQGVLLTELDRLDEALANYDRVLALKPDLEEALFNKANVLAALARYQEALAAYDRVLVKNPLNIGALNNRGNVLVKLRRTTDALACFDRVLAANPAQVTALNNRGNLFVELRRLPEAFASFDRAIAVDPKYVDALFNRGKAFVLLGQLEKAKSDYERVLAIDPRHAKALDGLEFCNSSMCKWIAQPELSKNFMAAALDGQIEPFRLLNMDWDPDKFLQAARSYTRRKIPAIVAPLYKKSRPPHEKIRLAYLSSDFRQHPIGFLIAGLLKLHDRTRFEVFGVSTGEDDGSAIRERLVQSFDQFIDARRQNDHDLAKSLAELEIDIIVDLNGHTDNARPGVLALRPAPIQISYLGFTGTMGADFIDYIIADRVVVPTEQQPFYAESVVHLPDCYFANDSSRSISSQPMNRTEAGLPASGFVFCAFNASYKIGPGIFALWMHLLGRVEGSVLWLSEMNEPARVNLRHEAESRGVDPARLIFAPRMPELADHLARHRLADLFVDTLPFNAHSTASDALWAGLPVVTCLGRSFPGRVAASMLHAVGLPELVTKNLGDYEALALKLAADAALLQSIRRRLDQNRLTYPLFDSARFRGNIEAAYRTMWEMHARGEKPRSFSVGPA